MKDNGFRQLRVYNEAIEWIAEVYLLLQHFPQEERYALCDQIKRAAVSVTSNIAEGTSRTSKKEYAHFLEISYGFLMEVQSQMDIALKLRYIHAEEHQYMENKIEIIAKMLSGLRKSILDSMQNNKKE